MQTFFNFTIIIISTFYQLHTFFSANNFFLPGNAFEDVDSYHDSIEEKQNKTLKNLEEIQETIAFMSNVSCIL